jgi:putative flippase GtrA
MRPPTELTRPATGTGRKLARKVPERWRKLAAEASKFGVVGVINTVVDFIVFNLFLPIGPLKANALSTVVATTSSYALNRHWTWRDQVRAASKSTVRREYVLFFLFNLIGFAIQIAVLGAAKYGLDFTEHDDRAALNIAKGVGIAIGTVFRFWAYRTWVFKSKPASADDEPEAGTPPVTSTVPTHPLPTGSLAKQHADDAAAVPAAAGD